MVKAVIFDIDNTLYDYDAAHARAFSTLTEWAGCALSLDPDAFLALHRRADDILKRRLGRCAAIHNRLIRYQTMLELAGLPVSSAPHMAELYWSTLLDAMASSPGVPEVLKRLKAMGFVVGVGTNMTADYQYAKLERLDAMPFIDFLVTSEEAGVEKPNPRLFALCAEKAGCAPAECLYVGDSLRGDVLAAMQAGMKAVWYRPKADDGAAAEVPTLDTLARLPECLVNL